VVSVERLLEFLGEGLALYKVLLRAYFQLVLEQFFQVV